MELFDGKKPKLCGIRTLMRAPVILSRVEVMNTLFSFLFNDGSRSFGDSSKICKTDSESENSLINSSLFEYTGSVRQKQLYYKTYLAFVELFTLSGPGLGEADKTLPFGNDALQ